MSLVEGIESQPMDYEVVIYKGFSSLSSDLIVKLILGTVSEFCSST